MYIYKKEEKEKIRKKKIKEKRYTYELMICIVKSIPGR